MLRCCGGPQMGYAPAQARLSSQGSLHDQLVWAQRAGAQGDRCGFTWLGDCLMNGHGCAKNEKRARDCYWQAAELGDPLGQFCFCQVGFHEYDWERCHWWAKAATAPGNHNFRLISAVIKLEPSFARGEHGRILFEIAPAAAVLRNGLDEDVDVEAGSRTNVLRLHNVARAKARAAVDCWSAVGRRLRVVKDMRVEIARLLWCEEKAPEEAHAKTIRTRARE
jgi:hypothetical protein